jgi:hypothetical protein
MYKKLYIEIMLVFAVVASATAAIAYQGGMLSNTATENIAVGAGPTTVPSNINGPTTAFTAVAIADNNAMVKEWKLKNPDAKVESISTQECQAGSASVWSFIFAGNSEKATVEVTNGRVALSIVNGTHASHTLDIAALIDSEKASSIATEVLSKDGYTPTGPATADLSYMKGYAGVWDLSYPIGNSYYILRLDASTGSVIGKAVIGAGGMAGAYSDT